MKLRLPHHLLRPLVVMAGLATSKAAIQHQDVSHLTYVDFASNAGRYATGATNELLDYIRQRDGGVKIEYTSGAEARVLPHGMPGFDSVVDMGNGTLINHNYLVTVKHNATLNPTFGANKYGVGAQNAIIYKGIEEDGVYKTFVLDAPQADYKLVRLSKLVTDAESADLYRPEYADGKTNMLNHLVYRVGGGEHWLKDYQGNHTVISSGGGYCIGGVGTVTYWEDKTAAGAAEDYKYAYVKGKESWGQNGFSAETPLPFGSVGGDSGSPYFVWNNATSGFELLMAHSGSYYSGETMVAQAAPEWTLNSMEQYSVRVNMKHTDGTVRICGVEKPEDKGEISTDVINGTTIEVASGRGYLYQGNGTTVTDAGGNAVSYAGVPEGMYTWKSLSGLKNNDAWYTYGNEYLNATESVWVDGDKNVNVATGLTYAKLYQTQNLVFESDADNASYAIKVTKDTDMGVGYLHFTSDKARGVQFTLSSDNGTQIHSAGYVVDVGVQVNVQLCNADAGYMREWRKVGEGTLHICGEGKNEIFLNVGGKGTTLLNQRDGYAAYNVLVNTGSTLKIANTGQIARDLTFGNGGGVLDMNGNSMDWYTTGGESREGTFTIRALTEEAVISNSSAQQAVLTYKQGETTSFAGSFIDSEDSSLGIVYDGGGTWVLNSIRTSLTHKDSSLTVATGTVKLAGTLTVHGYGAQYTQTTADFATRENDWHYADATMNVKVNAGATFELESHARLTGTVTVERGGKYIMHEGVQNAMEYIEGGEKLESTAAIADYYGHKGDVKLAETATLSWQFGSSEVASLRGNSADGGTMAGIESTISSPTRLKLAAAMDEPGRISAALLSLQDGVSLELCELYLAGGCSIAANSGQASVSMQDTTVAVADGNSVLSRGTLDSTLTLSMYGASDIQLLMAAGTDVLDIESGAIAGKVSLTGNHLVLDFSELSEPVKGLVRFHFGETVTFDSPESMTIQATYAGGTAVGYYNPAQAGFVYFHIPEPATSALGLLALAGLALRRRRA